MQDKLSWLEGLRVKLTSVFCFVFFFTFAAISDCYVLRGGRETTQRNISLPEFGCKQP